MHHELTVEKVVIRGFEDGDYPAAIRLSDAVYPDYPFSEAEWRHWDARYDGRRMIQRRLVAETPDGGLAGLGEFRHMSDMYHPQKFWVELQVHPDLQRRGIGSQVYDALMAAVAPFDPVGFWGNVRETSEAGRRFAEERGFKEKRRAWESRLNVPGFDPGPFQENADRAAAPYEIVTIAEEQARDPNWLEKAYDLWLEETADVPRADAFTPPSLDDYTRGHRDNPGYLPEGHFVMTDGDQYIAESYLFGSEQLPDVVYQGLTGTRRAYRGRGLALALKLRVVTFARERGYREIRTWNDTLNAPMLAINVKMGFARQPAWITYEKLTGAQERPTRGPDADEQGATG